MNNPFDWEQFNKQLKQRLPKWDERHAGDRLDMTWIETYVRDTLRQAFRATGSSADLAEFQSSDDDMSRSAASGDSDASQQAEAPDLHTDVMEMLRYVIVKIRVPELLNPRRIRIAASTDRVKIRILPHRKSQIVTLPHKIVVKNAKAVYSEQSIEVRLPKSKEGEPFKEIRIIYVE